MICDECETIAHCWKYGCIPKQETIAGRKVTIDWKSQTLELRELVRLGGIRIAELEAALAEQPAQQQEPVCWVCNGTGVELDDANTKTPCPNCAEQPAPVQQGWETVPVEPTVAMIDATGAVEVDMREMVVANWKEMLAAAPQPAQQEPVAWLVCENWRKHSLFFTEEGAEDFKNAAQREDALSGNLARWKAKPLYTSPPAQRTWVGLTDEEKREIVQSNSSPLGGMLDTEVKLKEKNFANLS